MLETEWQAARQVSLGVTVGGECMTVKGEGQGRQGMEAEEAGGRAWRAERSGAGRVG